MNILVLRVIGAMIVFRLPRGSETFKKSETMNLHARAHVSRGLCVPSSVAVVNRKKLIARPVRVSLRSHDECAFPATFVFLAWILLN